MSLDVGGATSKFQVTPRFSARPWAVSPSIKMEPAADEVTIRFAGKKRDLSTTAIKGGAITAVGAPVAIWLYQPVTNTVNWLSQLGGFGADGAPLVINALSTIGVGGGTALVVGAGAKAVQHRQAIWERFTSLFRRDTVNAEEIRQQAVNDFLSQLEKSGVDLSALNAAGEGAGKATTSKGRRKTARQPQESDAQQQGKGARVEKGGDDTLVIEE